MIIKRSDMKKLISNVLLAVAFTVGLCPVVLAEGLIVEDGIGDNSKIYHHRKKILSDSQKHNLSSIQGISNVFFENHEFLVYKAKTYTWDEVKNPIIFILEEGA